MKRLDFEKSGLLKLSIKYIIPSIFGMMFMSMQTIIDGFFIGKYAGENALASLNIVMPLISIVMAISIVIGIGAQSIISINLGANNVTRARNAFRTALVSCIVLGLLLCIVGVSLPKQIARLVGASELLVDNSAAYLRIIACVVPLVSCWFLFDFTLRILGKPHISLISMISSAATNIILDYVLVARLEMGMTGAAIATATAYGLACLICSIKLFNPKGVINVYKGKFQIKELGKMIYNGGSEGINSLSSAVTVMVFNMVLMKYAGEAGVASYTAIMYITQIGFSILFGIADGMRPIISYNYGANNHDKLKKIIKMLFTMGAITGVIATSLIFGLARPLAKIFVTSESVINMTVNGARIAAFAFLFSNFNVLASGFYTSINFAKESIIVSLLRGFVFMLAGVLILPLFLGVNGIWATFLLSDLLTFCIIFTLYMIQYKKKKFFNYTATKTEDEIIEDSDGEEKALSEIYSQSNSQLEFDNSISITDTTEENINDNAEVSEIAIPKVEIDENYVDVITQQSAISDKSSDSLVKDITLDKQ